MRLVHPGEILQEELKVFGLLANAVARALDMPAYRMSAILKGQRGVTVDTALRLSRFSGTWQVRRSAAKTPAYMDHRVACLFWA